jgi:hypothetical protein
MYDIRLDDTYPACGSNWPYELANITEYLQVRPRVNDAGSTRGSSFMTEKGRHSSFPRNREIYWLGGMRLCSAKCDEEPKFGIRCGIATQNP